MPWDYSMLNQQDLLKDWLQNACHFNIHQMQELHGDASLRKYYRVYGVFDDQLPGSLILMDARYAAEDTQQFALVSKLLDSLAVRVPKIYHVCHEQKLILLEDLGSTQLLDIININNIDIFYKNALDELATLQKNATYQEFNQLPSFNSLHMHTELQLFSDWFLNRHLNLTVDNNLLSQTFTKLVNKIDLFPKTIIHRDYHSRNLMVINNSQLGVIDFQDAMLGPRAYDVVSLLKDCYIVWEPNVQKRYCEYFLKKINKSSEYNKFWHEFQLCGLQRHLKVLGIFARIHYRDNKARYLQDLPRVWEYTINALEQLAEFKDFYQYLANTVAPVFLEKHPC